MAEKKDDIKALAFHFLHLVEDNPTRIKIRAVLWPHHCTKNILWYAKFETCDNDLTVKENVI